MHLGLPLLAVLAGAVEPEGASEAGARVELCAHPTAEILKAIRELRRSIESADLGLRTPGACAERIRGTSVARFAHRRGGTMLVLEPDQGPRLERFLPWITEPGREVEDLARMGRLSGLGVILEGLLAERHLLRDEGLASGPHSGGQERPTAPLRPERTGQAQAKAEETGVPQASPPGQDPQGTGQDPQSTGQDPQSAGHRAPNTAEIEASTERAPPSSPTPRFVPEIEISGIWRSPNVFASEIRLGASFDRLRVAVHAQPTTTWRFEDRPIDLSVWALSAAYSVLVVEAHPWVAQGAVGASVERLTLRRTDVGGAALHVVWDAGPSAEVSLGPKIDPPIKVEARLGASWRPTARRVSIPDGPSTRLNAFALSLSLALAWAP